MDWSIKLQMRFKLTLPSVWYSWDLRWTWSMVSTPCTSSILHCLISFRWVKLADSKAQNVNLKIQIHFLFLIRVAGDIFSSMENIEEKVQDFQDYLNTICTRYASELDLVILEFRHRKLPLPLYKRMNYNYFLKILGFWKHKLLPEFLHPVLPDVRKVHLRSIRLRLHRERCEDLQHSGLGHHLLSIRVHSIPIPITH